MKLQSEKKDRMFPVGIVPFSPVSLQQLKYLSTLYHHLPLWNLYLVFVVKEGKKSSGLAFNPQRPLQSHRMDPTLTIKRLCSSEN